VFIKYSLLSHIYTHISISCANFCGYTFLPALCVSIERAFLPFSFIIILLPGLFSSIHSFIPPDLFSAEPISYMYVYVCALVMMPLCRIMNVFNMNFHFTSYFIKLFDNNFHLRNKFFIFLCVDSKYFMYVICEIRENYVHSLLFGCMCARDFCLRSYGFYVEIF
jgi:hypothetical protein